MQQLVLVLLWQQVPVQRAELEHRAEPNWTSTTTTPINNVPHLRRRVAQEVCWVEQPGWMAEVVVVVPSA